MDLKNQRTLKKAVSFEGIALHTGDKAKITFRPAPQDSGVSFLRRDLEGAPSIPAHLSHVISVARGTTIGNGRVKVHTVEHVLASLMGFGIDNLVIEMDASEPPLGDGSALPFVEMIKAAGIEELPAPKKIFQLEEPIFLEEENVNLIALPCDVFRVSFVLSYKNTILKDQYHSFTIDPKTFEKEIAPSRTFGFYEEVEDLMKRGLIKGGSLDNAVVIVKDAILCKEKLRFEDEFVRHKILDIIGDLFLIGKFIKAHVIAVKSGHEMNIELAKQIEARSQTAESRSSSHG